MSQDAPHPIQDWSQQYDRILNSYATHPSEDLMQEASDLGHALFEAGVPPEDVVAAHTASVGQICGGGAPQCSDRMAAVTPLFLELMMAYGIGFRRQKSLIEQLGDRTKELEQTIAQRERAEDALQLTQFTVDHMSDAVFWMDSRGKFFSVNEKACKSLGYSLDELLKMSVRDIDPDYPQERFDQLWKACRDSGSTTIESHHRRRDGHVFPVEITVKRMEFKGRSFLCALIRDTTERKQAQDALRKARDELEIRVEERTAELKKINTQLWREIEVRRRVEETLRTTSTQLTTIITITDAIAQFLKNGNWQEASTTILRSAIEQTQSAYGFVGVVVEGPSLRTFAIEGIDWDPTAGREAYDATWKSFQQDGYLDFTNLDNLFGRVISEKKLVISDDPASDPRSRGLPVGHPRLHAFMGVPIFSGDEIVGMIGLANRAEGYPSSEQEKIKILSRLVGILFDSYLRHQNEVEFENERRRLNEDCRKRESELAHVTRLSTLGEMASGLAHELNQPLAAITSYASASLRSARSGSSDPNIYCEDMTRICEQAERAGGIIRKLRRFVRRTDPHQSTVNVNRAVQEVLELIETEIRHENVRILLELADEELEVLADNIQIQQVILNLVRNGIEAIHSIPEEIRQIVIRSFKAANDCVEVTVFDNGSGFSDEMSEKLFQPFFTTKERGLGLGLSISRSIIEAHGGRLWATGDEGSGATFHLSLPLKQKESSS